MSDRALSVEPYHKHGPIRRVSLRRQLFRPLAIVIQHAHPYPPIACRTGKPLHLSCAIAPLQMVSQFIGSLFMRKSAYLHRPFSTCFQRRRSFHHLDLYLRYPRQINIQLLRRRQRQIDNASWNKRTPIRNPHQRPVSRLQIRHAHHRTQRQCAMCRRHRVHVVDLAIRPAPVVIRRPIPAGQPSLSGKRYSARRNRRLGKIGASLVRQAIVLRRPLRTRTRSCRRSFRTGRWRRRNIYVRLLRMPARGKKRKQEKNDQRSEWKSQPGKPRSRKPKRIAATNP
jgi:hypothetical protein